jgi:ParB-like chromosome segregation protein Spo0J
VYTEGVYATNYIVVKKSENGGYVVLDGVHRASLLKKNNITNIIVAILNDE